MPVKDKLKMSKSPFITLLMILFAFSCSPPPSRHQPEPDSVIKKSNPDAAAPENRESITEHSHDDSDPHMRMTPLRRAPNEDDRRRAEEIANRAGEAIEKYKDYRAALADGFEILLPEVPQNMYHFNKLENYLESESRFNPERPTSLLYEKTSSGGYLLVGVMYTAPAGMSEDELNERVPLSITQWHEHVNICLPKGTDIFRGLIGQGERFGLNGSITTRKECEQAGGQFLPRLLGWMVHLYPYEATVEKMWSIERQMDKNNR
jgi:hypothetical protein